MSEEKKTKYCSKCRNDLSYEEFHKDKRTKSGLQGYCKKCSLKYQGQYRFKPQNRRKRLKYRFNITIDEYNQLCEFQDNKCAICGKEETSTIRGTVKLLAVDHCHKSNIIRGLLCMKCNTALGSFNDNIGLLLKAIEYLKK